MLGGVTMPSGRCGTFYTAIRWYFDEFSINGGS
ncbi:ABC-type uncharacterized transport system [Zymobacter palmae]|uniref:ABC-type uncharacterized transport system n=1 Tax=Zymobacter palmae TaxID=33074 RepID=A0A348HBL1_9GAMM|nr:ABC-type uncharacterized transport system [Zymobacter palmae]